MVRCAKKAIFKIFTHCYRNGSFECFFTEKGLGPLGVKSPQSACLACIGQKCKRVERQKHTP